MCFYCICFCFVSKSGGVVQERFHPREINGFVTAFLSLAQPAAKIDNIITKRRAASKGSALGSHAELAIQVENAVVALC
jgi:hypothetical protein